MQFISVVGNTASLFSPTPEIGSAKLVSLSANVPISLLGSVESYRRLIDVTIGRRENRDRRVLYAGFVSPELYIDSYTFGVLLREIEGLSFCFGLFVYPRVEDIGVGLRRIVRKYRRSRVIWAGSFHVFGPPVYCFVLQVHSDVKRMWVWSKISRN